MISLNIQCNNVIQKNIEALIICLFDSKQTKDFSFTSVTSILWMYSFACLDSSVMAGCHHLNLTIQTFVSLLIGNWKVGHRKRPFLLTIDGNWGDRRQLTGFICWPFMYNPEKLWKPRKFYLDVNYIRTGNMVQWSTVTIPIAVNGELKHWILQNKPFLLHPELLANCIYVLVMIEFRILIYTFNWRFAQVVISMSIVE